MKPIERPMPFRTMVPLSQAPELERVCARNLRLYDLDFPSDDFVSFGVAGAEENVWLRAQLRSLNSRGDKPR